MTNEEFIRLYNDTDVKIETIAKRLGCSCSTVRSNASRLGFANRRKITRRPAPLCDDEPPEELQEAISRRIERRAAALRRGWSRADYLKRQMALPGQQRRGPAVIATPAGDTACFGAGIAPAFMTGRLRTDKQVYRDRKTQAKKECAARINHHQEGDRPS